MLDFIAKRLSCKNRRQKCLPWALAYRPSGGSVHPRGFDLTDSRRPTAMARRRRWRWLRLARAPSSRPAGAKSEYDALVPCERRGGLRHHRRACCKYTSSGCSMTGPRQDEGEPGRYGRISVGSAWGGRRKGVGRANRRGEGVGRTWGGLGEGVGSVWSRGCGGAVARE